MGASLARELVVAVVVEGVRGWDEGVEVVVEVGEGFFDARSKQTPICSCLLCTGLAGSGRSPLPFSPTSPRLQQNAEFILHHTSLPLFNLVAEGGANRQRPRLLLGRSVFYPHLNATLPIFPLSASFEAISFCHFHFASSIRAPKCQTPSCRCHTTTKYRIV